MEVFKLNAAIKLLDEVSPTVDQINDALGEMEKALGVTRAEVEKNRKAMEEMTAVGKQVDFALEALGVTTEEYFEVLEQQRKATQDAAEAMDKMHDEALKLDQMLPKAGDGARAFSQAADGISGVLFKVGGVLTGLTAGISMFVNESRSMAIAAVESENLFEVSFGNMAGAARDWSVETAKALGVNEYNLRKSSGMMYTMMNSMGLVEDKAYEVSTSLTQLSLDMASYYNISVEDAMQKLQGGMTGEAESLKRLGIIVNEAAIQQAAYKHGLEKSVESMTNAEKAMVRYYAIMDATQKAQGDLARTLESPANQMRRMAERMEELKIKLGMALMPVFKDFINIMSTEVIPIVQKLIMWFEKLSEKDRRIIAFFGGIVLAVGPAMLALGGMISTLGSLSQAYLGLVNLKAAGGLASLFGGLDKVAALASGGGGLAGLASNLALIAGYAAAIWAVWEAATALGKAIDEFFQISSSGDPIIDKATEKVGLFKATISLLPDIFNFLKSVAQELWAAFSDVSSFIGNTLVQTVKDLFNTLDSLWNSVALGTMAVDGFKELWKLVGPAVEHAGKALWDVVKIVSPIDELAASLGGVKTKIDEITESTMKWAKAHMFKEQIRAASEGEAAFLKQASVLANREIKTVAEATKVYQELNKAIVSKDKAARMEEKNIEKALVKQEDLIAKQLLAEKNDERIKKAKKLMGQEKNKDLTYTIEEANAILKKAEAMGLYKEKVDEATKSQIKASKEIAKQRDEIEKMQMAAEKGFQKEQSAARMRAIKDSPSNDIAFLTAQESAMSAVQEGEMEIASLQARLDDLREKLKGAAVPPEVTASYEKWFELIRKNAKEKGQEFFDKVESDKIKQNMAPIHAEMEKLFGKAKDTKSEFQALSDAVSFEVGANFEEIDLGDLKPEALAAINAELQRMSLDAITSGKSVEGLADAMARVKAATLAQAAERKGDKNYEKRVQLVQKEVESQKQNFELIKEQEAQQRAFVADLLQRGIIDERIAKQMLPAQVSNMQRLSQLMQGLISFAALFGDTFGQSAQIISNTVEDFKAISAAQDTAASNAAARGLKVADYLKTEAGAADQAAISNAKFNAVLNAGASIATMFGVSLMKSTDATLAQAGAALQAAAAGAKMGSAFGPIGAGIGAGIGAVFGWINAGKKMRAETKKMYEDFEKANGGLDKMTAKAKEAGISLESVMKNKGTKNVEGMKKAIQEATEKLSAFDDLIQSTGSKDIADLKIKAAEAGISLQKIWDAKSVQQYKDAVDGVKKQMAEWDEAQSALQGAMDKYGITVDQLGGKYRQAGFDKMGIELLKNFEVLKAAGVDVSLITEKMSEDMSTYVNKAVAAGNTIPLAMKPMIEDMIKTGQLLDENGKAYASLEDAGVSFAQTLEEGIGSAVEAINKLVAVLAKGFNIPVDVYAAPGSETGSAASAPRNAPQDDGLPSYAGGSGGFRNFGKEAIVKVHGIEAIVRPQDLQRSPAPSSDPKVEATLNLHINENPMQTAETVEQMRRFTVDTVEKEISKNLAEMVRMGNA